MSGTSTRQEQVVDVSLLADASEFSALVRNVWRALVRVTRAAEHLPELPESQVDALRALAQAGELTPGALAEELRLARPTVSNLVRDMVAGGLVERRRSSVDGRSAILVPTPRAVGILDRFATARVDLVASILARLEPGDLHAIQGAIPALRQLLAELDTELAERGRTEQE
ncbi:MAG: MarR family winged helix-turn-helix transcriptional regulator [Propionicimonas sp.]|uniref:MarR family winged helix-turn-helix transcriptional regulator n=1 Tax=Propionicimonas sp. TaxID=1955623 RepID=UPI003D12B4ED